MNKKKLLSLVLAFNLCVLSTTSTFAWHANGHSIAGAIAYYYLLKNNPAVLAKVLTSLKQHYWYKTSHWQSRLAQLPADKQDVGLFMLASVYPDDAKNDKGNIDGHPKHKNWHYVDFPFVVPGSGAQGAPPKTPNAQLEIAALISTIPGESESAKKALDLSWIFHLIEDIH